MTCFFEPTLIILLLEFIILVIAVSDLTNKLANLSIVIFRNCFMASIVISSQKLGTSCSLILNYLSENNLTIFSVKKPLISVLPLLLIVIIAVV